MTRFRSLMPPLLLLTLLTGCAPDHGPLTPQNALATARHEAGICSPTPAEYDHGWLAYDLVNNTNQALTVERIQPRSPRNLTVDINSLVVGPKTTEIGNINIPTTNPAAIQNWHPLTNTHLPAHSTYQFAVRFDITNPRKTAYLRDFVVTYRDATHTYEGATAFGYTFSKNGGCDT